MSNELETGMAYLDCVLDDADLITEGLAELVTVLGGAMLALEAFYLLETILWRNISRGSYWGWFRGWSSFDLC